MVVDVNKSAYLAHNAARDAHSRHMPLTTQGTSTAKCARSVNPDNPIMATQCNMKTVFVSWHDDTCICVLMTKS